MIILQSILTSCPSYRVVLYSVILPDLSQASLILSRNCARPDNTILQAASEAVCLIVNTHHFIFGHSEAASLGTWNWFLRVVLALLEVVGEAVQLDHHRAAIQLIVTPVRIQNIAWEKERKIHSPNF